MRFIITCMDGFELHLYVDEKWEGYMDFDKIEDARYVAKQFLKLGLVK